jgi:hypothetical protein
MKLKFSEWVDKIVPQMVIGQIEKAEADVFEGRAIACFHEWEIRIELTPNRAIQKRIMENM